jgi:hypothetical protein
MFMAYVTCKDWKCDTASTCDLWSKIFSVKELKQNIKLTQTLGSSMT